MRKTKSFAQAIAAQDQQVNWRKLWLRAAVSLLASAGFVWLLLQRLSHIDLGDLLAGFETIGLQNWAAALGLTLISFAAVGHYDVVMHRHFDSGLPPAAARRAGICAIAVSQTLGLGLITGSILRWRMLPGQSLWACTRLTAAVAASFLIGWALVTALTLCLLPQAPFRGLAGAALAVLVAMGLLALLPPRFLRALPNGATLGRLVILTALDTFAAAAALWVLCPAGTDLGFLALLPAFLLAFGAGLISGAPGGVGPFEMALLTLLPDQPEASLLTAILAWRACYYGLPAVLGAGVAMLGAKPFDTTQTAQAWHLLHHSRRAELALARQGQHRLIAQHHNSGSLIARTHHFRIGLFDPVTEPKQANLRQSLEFLERSAKSASCSAALYKTGARLAAVARAKGYICLRIASEATVSPATYTLDAPARAALRRKLRRAEAAGVSVTHPQTRCDWQALTAIATAWAQAHGGERGFSMGRFCPQYLRHQRLYIAWQDGHPIAFVSFHLGAREWTLDLMRHAACLPDGTMHALIQAAIDDAKSLGVQQVSLAAVPDYRIENSLARKLITRLSAQSAGLTRFKSAFAPDFRPLYLCAPNRAALGLAAVEIARAIHAPAPLPTAKLPEIEQDYADIEFASGGHSWHRQLE